MKQFDHPLRLIRTKVDMHLDSVIPLERYFAPRRGDFTSNIHILTILPRFRHPNQECSLNHPYYGR